MTVHRITWRPAADGPVQKFESVNKRAALRRLSEVRQADPNARLLSIPAAR